LDLPKFGKLKLGLLDFERINKMKVNVRSIKIKSNMIDLG
jgi:hypothetical protein